MTRFFFIALITLIGFFLTPTDAYACGSKSENLENTCAKQSDTNKEMKGCCSTENEQCCKNTKNCNGKCGNPSCHCPSNSTIFTMPFFVQFSFFKLNYRKPKFYFKNTNYSSGIVSIWQPPKIG